MKTMKKVQVPAREDWVVSQIICDLCANEIEPQCYIVNAVRVEYRVGTAYPEGGMGNLTSFDICGGCFEDVLCPFLAEKGARPVVTEWDT